MPKTPLRRVVVTPKVFDRLFQTEAIIADVSKSADERRYERRDSKLIQRIRAEVEKHFPAGGDIAPFVGDDWWPNHTRYLEMGLQQCTVEFLGSLRSLLTKPFDCYRIQLVVFDSWPAGRTQGRFDGDLSRPHRDRTEARQGRGGVLMAENAGD